MRFLSFFSGTKHSIRSLHVNLQTTYLKPYSGFLPCLNSLFNRYLCRYQPLFLHVFSCFDVLIDILLFGDAMNRVSTIFSVLVTRRIAPDYETCHGASLHTSFYTLHFTLSTFIPLITFITFYLFILCDSVSFLWKNLNFFKKNIAVIKFLLTFAASFCLTLYVWQILTGRSVS